MKMMKMKMTLLQIRSPVAHPFFLQLSSLPLRLYPSFTSFIKLETSSYILYCSITISVHIFEKIVFRSSADLLCRLYPKCKVIKRGVTPGSETFFGSKDFFCVFCIAGPFLPIKIGLVSVARFVQLDPFLKHGVPTQDAITSSVF